jgi:hypothetical protein
MMKRIIVLEGSAECGKSSTIKRVYRSLVDSFFYRRDVDAKVHGRLGRKETHAIIELDAGKIGIESMGDRPGMLKEKLAELASQGCNIIICAARNTTSFKDVVKRVAGYEAMWVTKFGAGDDIDAQSSSDTVAANDIVSRVHEALRVLAA